MTRLKQRIGFAIYFPAHQASGPNLQEVDPGNNGHNDVTNKIHYTIINKYITQSYIFSGLWTKIMYYMIDPYSMYIIIDDIIHNVMYIKRHLRYERVYLPRCEVANTPFQIQVR